MEKEPNFKEVKIDFQQKLNTYVHTADLLAYWVRALLEAKSLGKVEEGHFKYLADALRDFDNV